MPVMIPAETRYKTHNGELLAIVEAFKTWRNYLEGYQHEVLVLTDHNNLHRFMDTKSLSSRQADGLKNSLNTTSELIIAKARLIELLMLCPVSPREARARQKIFGLRIFTTQILYRLQSLLTQRQPFRS